MPRITKIETQKHSPDRFNVYLDGSFGFGASAFVLTMHGLVEGLELSDEELQSIAQDDAAERAYAAGLNFLSFRPRSRREVEQYFRRKAIDPAVAEAALERLARAGLLNDGEFARFWVENRQTFRPRGRRALQAELRQKGLDAEDIDGALEAVDEEAMARQAALKRMRGFERLEGEEFLQRMSAFLVRRGFGYGVAASMARQMLQERDGEAD